MPSHAFLHISLNVCHVTSQHPPHPTPPCIPTHPYKYPPMFVMLLHTTQPPPTIPHHPPPTHAFLHISPNVCHVTSHHPTHAFPCIPTHIPQCLSCYFTPPTPCHPCLPMHPYTYLPMFVMLLLTTHPTPPRPTHPTPHHQPTPSDACLPYPTPKYFLSIGGGGSKIILYTPQILKGNGVVFKTFTNNNF